MQRLRDVSREGPLSIYIAIIGVEQVKGFVNTSN